MDTSSTFIVLSHLATLDCALKGNFTAHFSLDRQERHNKIVRIIGEGIAIATFRVDKGHRNGYELHHIYSNGIIVIQNERTRKIITEIVARPTQISRYWELSKEEMPKSLFAVLALARIHQKNGYNYW